jgi:hypothetical protein
MLAALPTEVRATLTAQAEAILADESGATAEAVMSALLESVDSATADALFDGWDGILAELENL